MHAQTAAMAADDAGFSVFHLALGFDFIAAQLAHGLGDVQHAFDVRLREQAAVGIHRQLAADLDAAVFDEILAFAFLAESHNPPT